MSRRIRIRFFGSSGVMTRRCLRWRKISGLAILDGELDLPCDKSPDDQGKEVQRWDRKRIVGSINQLHGLLPKS